MTGAFWRSAFVAAVFAIHPLHVNRLPGAERGCSAFFCVNSARIRSLCSRTIDLALFNGGILFALGRCQPMLVTLPFVLLLLDHWPLGRIGRGISVGRQLLSGCGKDSTYRLRCSVSSRSLLRRRGRQMNSCRHWPESTMQVSYVV
jgi:hypothetical protein